MEEEMPQKIYNRNHWRGTNSSLHPQLMRPNVAILSGKQENNVVLVHMYFSKNRMIQKNSISKLHNDKIGDYLMELSSK